MPRWDAVSYWLPAPLAQSSDIMWHKAGNIQCRRGAWPDLIGRPDSNGEIGRQLFCSIAALRSRAQKTGETFLGSARARRTKYYLVSARLRSNTHSLTQQLLVATRIIS